MQKGLTPEILQLVLFDMDGVVLDSMPAHVMAWQNAFAEIGINLSSTEILQNEGMSGYLSVKKFFLENNRDFPDKKAYEQLLKRKDFFFSQNIIKPFDEIEPIFSFLKEKGVSIWIVTGSSLAILESNLSNFLKNMIDGAVTGDDVVHGKPNPEPYLIALKKSYKKKENAIVVENAPMGVVSAKNAGLFTLAIETTLPVSHLGEADSSVKNHNELKVFLESFFS